MAVAEWTVLGSSVFVFFSILKHFDLELFVALAPYKHEKKTHKKNTYCYTLCIQHYTHVQLHTKHLILKNLSVQNLNSDNINKCYGNSETEHANSLKPGIHDTKQETIIKHEAVKVH